MRERRSVQGSWSLSSFVAGVVVALVVGGTAFAAGQITGKNVKNSSLTGKDVKNKSLTKADFKGSVAGSPGPQGPQGPQGARGPTGPAGPLGTAGGSLAGTYPNPTIAPGAVDASALATGAVAHDGTGSDGSTKLATNSVNYNEIGPNAVRDATFKAQGTTTQDFDMIGANSCQQKTVTVGSAVDQNDVIILTAPSEFVGTEFIVTAINGLAVNEIRVQVCNPRASAFNPPSASFNYVVIDS